MYVNLHGSCTIYTCTYCKSKSPLEGWSWNVISCGCLKLSKLIRFHIALFFPSRSRFHHWTGLDISLGMSEPTHWLYQTYTLYNMQFYQIYVKILLFYTTPVQISPAKIASCGKFMINDKQQLSQITLFFLSSVFFTFQIFFNV